MKKKLFAAIIGLLVLCLLATGAMGATSEDPVDPVISPVAANHNWGEYKNNEGCSSHRTHLGRLGNHHGGDLCGGRG